MEVLRFQTNVPEEVALKFGDGKGVAGKYGDQVLFTLTDGRLMYLPPAVAERIRELGIVRGEVFQVVKREVAKDGKRFLVLVGGEKGSIQLATLGSTERTMVLDDADSAPIPTAFDGTTFNAATHTHYLFTASTTLANADMTALVSTVIEHTQVGVPTVWINTAQRTAVAALTGFIPITPTNVTPAYTSPSVVQAYDRNTPNNQLIGYLANQNYAEVWVKPWIPAGYLFAYMANSLKPLKIRTRNEGSEALILAAEDEEHPLRCRVLTAEFGVGVWQRTAGAVLFVDSGGAAAYVAPAIV